MPQVSDPTKSTHVEQAIAGFKSGALTREQTVSKIEHNAFRDVLPRFHIVDGVRSTVTFYTYHSSGLSLTDAVFMVFQSPERHLLLREINSKWSQLEETFARSRLGDNVSVWVVSNDTIGHTANVWCRADASDGSILATGNNIRILVNNMSSELASGQKVCLGFKAPLTIFVPLQPDQLPTPGPKHVKHFSVSEPECFQFRLSKLEDSARALVTVAWTLRELKNSILETGEPTLNWRRFVDNYSNLFIWEAAISRTLRLCQGIDRAHLAVNGFLNLYPRLHLQYPPEDHMPFSLGTAVLCWAGFRPQQDSFFSPSVIVKAG